MPITLQYKSLRIYVENYKVSPYLKNMVETEIRIDRIDDAYDMNILEELCIDEWDLFHYCSYLNNGLIGVKHINLDLLDYMGHRTDILIDMEYYACYLRDEWVKNTMEEQEDVDYGLIRLCCPKSIYVYIVGDSDESGERFWNDCPHLKDIEDLFPGLDYVICGGYCISQYTNGNNNYKDVDIYFIGDDCDKALELLKNNRDIRVEFVSDNAITFTYRNIRHDLQLILRRYKSIAEILTNFDLDCCSIAIYRRQFYCTWKAKYELDNKTIVVDWRKMSYTYPYRLYKYREKIFKLHYPEEVSNVALEYGPYIANIMGRGIHQSTMDIIIKEDEYIKKFNELGLVANPTNIDNLHSILNRKNMPFITNINKSINIISEFILLSEYKFAAKKHADYSTPTKGLDIQSCTTILPPKLDTSIGDEYSTLEELIGGHNLHVLNKY